MHLKQAWFSSTNVQSRDDSISVTFFPSHLGNDVPILFLGTPISARLSHIIFIFYSFIISLSPSRSFNSYFSPCCNLGWVWMDSFLLLSSVNAHSGFNVDISATQEEAEPVCTTVMQVQVVLPAKTRKWFWAWDGVMMRSFDQFQFNFYRAGININGIEWIWYSGRALTQEMSLKECLSDLKQVHFYTCYFLLP